MSKKIMVVDDEPDTVDLVKLVLETEGFEVMTAYSGSECLMKLEKEEPDAVLLDIMMPELDGFAVLRKLKADPATKDIEVIMLTNLSDTDSYKKALELGANGYLVKIDNPPEKLIDEVEKHIHV